MPGEVVPLAMDAAVAAPSHDRSAALVDRLQGLALPGPQAVAMAAQARVGMPYQDIGYG